jgi:hypothetical protein
MAMSCPGPSAPTYDCVGLRRGMCPLAKVADLVVLDNWTDADRAEPGPRDRNLLAFYTRQGLPVLLVRPGACPEFYGDEDAAGIDWP